MNPPVITLHVDPAPAVTDPLGEALREFNRSQVGPYRRESIAVVAHNEDGDFVGGIQGVLLFGWLHIERLWVAEGCRGQGTGGALLGRIESAAVEKGARWAALLTTTWQAPDFYRKRGYLTVASFPLTLDAASPGGEAVDYLLRKDLERAPVTGP